MYVEQLTAEERAVARTCLAYIVESRAIEHEFETRLGISRAEAAALLMRWPKVDDESDDSPACLAINNALNEVANGLAISHADWARLGSDRPRVAAALARYATLRGWHPPEVR